MKKIALYSMLLLLFSINLFAQTSDIRTTDGNGRRGVIMIYQDASGGVHYWHPDSTISVTIAGASGDGGALPVQDDSLRFIFTDVWNKTTSAIDVGVINLDKYTSTEQLVDVSNDTTVVNGTYKYLPMDGFDNMMLQLTITDTADFIVYGSIYESATTTGADLTGWVDITQDVTGNASPYTISAATSTSYAWIIKNEMYYHLLIYFEPEDTVNEIDMFVKKWRSR